MAAGALRVFAHGKTRTGTLLAGLFVVGFAGWSLAVRYSPIIAAVGLLIGIVALRWAARMPTDGASAQVEAPHARPFGWLVALRAMPLVVVPCLSGFLFYAYLRWGPKSWADPKCGASFLLPVFLVAVGVSGLTVWGTARAAGRRTEAVAAAAVIAALLAAAICVVGFLI